MADLTSGLTTRIDKSSEPWRLRVEAIGWTSPFRGTDLRVGDTIVVADGVPVDLSAGGHSWALVGQYGESGTFRDAGRKAGDPLKLWVKRGVAGREGDIFAVVAPLVEPQGWRNAENRELLGPGGPITMDQDGFAVTWGSWAEPFRDKIAYLLDTEQHTASFNGAFEAKELTERHGARIAFAVEHYPGRWSASVKEDYDRALAIARGEPLETPPSASPDPAPVSPTVKE